MGFIYKITCKTTGKVYIGQTRNSVETRFKQHIRDAKVNKAYLDGETEKPVNKKGMSSKLYRAMNKYGYEDFSVEVLKEVSNELLDAEEEAAIVLYNAVSDGYNLKHGGNASCHSEETKELLRKKNSENMKTTYKKVRKHDDITHDLPMYCIYLVKRDVPIVAIHGHPLCKHKEFSSSSHGSIENAKVELLKYLEGINNGSIIHEQFVKNEDLPKGVRKIKDNCFVDKTIKGVTYRKYFSGGSYEENKAAAILYLEEIMRK